MDSFPGGVPTADLLDRVCPDRPVFLPNRDHHSAWVNSRARSSWPASTRARRTRPTAASSGRPTAGRPVRCTRARWRSSAGSSPAPTADELRAALLTAQAHLHSLGIVGWQDALVGEGLGMPDTLDTYLAAHGSGLLTAKVVLALWWDRDRGLEQLPELVERRQRAAAAGLRATA